MLYWFVSSSGVLYSMSIGASTKLEQTDIAASYDSTDACDEECKATWSTHAFSISNDVLSNGMPEMPMQMLLGVNNA